MVKINIIKRDGSECEIEAVEGHTLREGIRNAGINELAAVCGGCCSCATCHVHIDPNYLDKLPAQGDIENDLLDSSEHRNATSRLSCQIEVQRTLEGMRVHDRGRGLT